MLISLNAKVEKVIDLLNSKADQAEVLKLRDRMHKVEGGQSAVVWLNEQLHDVRSEVRKLDEKVDHLESTQVTEGAVRKALEEARLEQRKTIQWVVGLLASLGGVNLWINITQG